jgi:hypothetical protein
MKAKIDLACAASHVEVDWPAMDWRKVTQNVRRLQARIVKATRVTVVKPRPSAGR